MSRIVSVWLPRWPILRFLAAQAIVRPDKPVDPDRPFVLAIAGAGGSRIATLNVAAEQAGLAPGEPLADARAKAGFLQVRAVAASADDAALRRLALWATRYTPTASPWNESNGADGFFLDIEGSAHLFGGETRLLADLAGRLERFGLPARLAVADTPGAAWAASRFHRAPLFVLPSGQEAAALAAMPIEALRLGPETRTALRRLGFKNIGALIDQPRAPFAARFAAELLRRLDQAFGRVEEQLVPIVAPPIYHSLHYLLEPVVTAQAIVAWANRLMQNLVHVLTRDDVGARSLRLCLYRVDGAVETIEIGLTLPTRSVSHVARLIGLKLEALTALQDDSFGFEAIGLAVTRAETMPARQIEFVTTTADGDRAERCAALVDALRQRLGPQSVRRFEAVASHVPERAEILPPVDRLQFPPPGRGRVGVGVNDVVGVNTVDVTPPRLAPLATLPLSGEGKWPEPEQPRPLLLLPRAEPTEVTALVPDGPPRRFCWRGVTYDVEASQGPERIGAEWWRAPYLSAHFRESNGTPHRANATGTSRGDERQQLTRDYYLVEDANGRRFWLFREGLYGRETVDARWFVHGLFA
jgi:protein ImuB